jgi:hypothetical protein
MQSELLLKFKSKDKSPKYYQNYSRLFFNYFNDIDVNTITDLCNAGYLYYQSILLTDSLIDDKEYSNLPLISTCQEETIKILTSVYGMDSDFWKYWKKRKNEYFEAVKIEKGLNLNDNVDFEIYEDLADKKSSFGKIAIDSLYVFSKYNNKEKYQALLQSHKYFSLGFQLYDDVKDFKEDFKNGQFNWAIYTLNKKLTFLDYNNEVSILNKLLFIENIGQELLEKSITYFQKSLKIIDDFKTESEWEEVIIEMEKTIENYLDITNANQGLK